VLTLGELELTARTGLPVFLPFNHTGIPGEEPVYTELFYQSFVKPDEGAGDTVPDGSGLTAFAATMNGNEDVKITDLFQHCKRLPGDNPIFFTMEEFFNFPTVDGHLAVTGAQIDPGYRRLSTSRSYELFHRLRPPLPGGV
jgi:hypothetical protein